jgi:hypothetical protein
MKKILLIVFSLTIIFICNSFSQEYKWYKGNTHTHTTLSDGDELPRRVVRWYQDNNYNFLVLSDHNSLTEIKYLDSDKNDDFLLIPGEEVTDSYNKKPIHVNAINLKKKIDPQHGNSIVETAQNDINAVRKAGAIPQLNHPSWRRPFTDQDIIALKDCKLIEVYNIAKESNNFAAGGFMSTEQIWDKALSKGNLMYGVGSDDAHNYLGDLLNTKSIPGRAWVKVRAKELTPEAICASFENGDFYSSTGVNVVDIKITDKEYTLEIKADPDPFVSFTTFFIGKDGKILKEDYNLKASYQFKGDELYVRAKVFASTGDFAILQPVFLKK